MTIPAPAIEANAPWWQQLPNDFCRQPDRTELDAQFPLAVRTTAAMDRGLRTWLASMISGAMAASFLNPTKLKRQMAMLDFYRDLGSLHDVDAVYHEPPRNQAVHREPCPRLGYQPRGIPCEQLTFASPFRAINPEIRSEYASRTHNQRAIAQHWTHPSGPRPTLVVVHGFIADPYWMNSLMFSLKWFYKRGYDILLYTQPFHGARRAPLEPFSGFGYFSQGLAHTNEAMLQSIHDLRIFIDHLEQRGTPSIGVTGLSLGGYATASLACVDDRIDFAIPNSPVVSPVDLFLEWIPTRWAAAALMKWFDLTPQDLRHATALHAAMNYQPKIDPKNLLIIGGAGDRITPPRHTKLLHEHWPGSKLHWFPGNHIVHLQQGRYLKFMKTFMDLRSGIR